MEVIWLMEPSQTKGDGSSSGSMYTTDGEKKTEFRGMQPNAVISRLGKQR